MNLLTALAPLHSSLPAGNVVGWVVTVIAVIIGGGLLCWALSMTINNFAPAPWRGKLTALMYIVIALLLAGLVFHFAGLV